jgi:hypothetical protein
MPHETDEAVKAILDMLPTEHEGQEKRQYALTRRDGEFMLSLIKLAIMNQGCSIGLSEQQMEALKNIPAKNISAMNDMVKERKNLLNALGALSLLLLAGMGKVLFSAFEWKKIWKFMTGA